MSGIALGGAVAAMPGIALAAPAADDLAAIEGLVQEYFSGRALRVTHGGASAGPVDLLVPSTRSFTQRQRSDHEQLKSRRAVFGRFGGYERSQTKTTVLSVSGDAARPLARVREETTLYFVSPRACGGRFTAYTVEHDVQFVRDGGVLRLDSAQFISSDYRDLPETQFLDAVPAKFRGPGPAKGSGIKPGTGEPPRSPKVVAGQTFGDRTSANLQVAYDYGRMIEYAIRYGLNYDPSALYYSDDCTAFISECMNYGFWQHTGSWPGQDRTSNSQWFRGSYTWTTTYSWGGAENWYWFATGSGRTYILSELDWMVPSDVLQWNWPKGNPPDDILDHTQICTDIYIDPVLGLGDQYMTQHSSNHHDYVNRSLNYILSYQTWTYQLYAHRT
ncbi:amidase domain-containing protein [Dactylosporangium sp. NPDC050588]|uniref:amidase domain-containing protein n=1 Tax=Dactylosporangium sp. NPDC050588 TaxID=3157211 RepID=UPI0033F524B1